MKRTDDKTEPAPVSLRLEHLPVATMATRDGAVVAVNDAFVELTGWSPSSIVGRSLLDLLGQLVAPSDHGLLERLLRAPDGLEKRGSLWCRLQTAEGEERPVRVEWNRDVATREALVFFLDARPEAHGQRVTDALARVAGVLSRSASEEDVLQRAVDALCTRGFTATVLLIDEDDPLLRYGPSRGPGAASRLASLELPRPPKGILMQVNPAFMDRRAAFFQDGKRLVNDAFAEPLAERVLALVPAPRMVQAPLFVADVPYGALIVTGETLNPIVAAALDLFAELVGKALEAVRLRRELMESERLAALGEAAGVMAHEVRNPVGAIMNALTLLERADRSSEESRTLLSIIGEETARLEQLVSQLLELGRPLLPRPRSYELEALTARAVRLLETRGEFAHQSIELPSTKGSVAWFDPDLAELSVVNVVRNAMQSARSRIRIRVELAATWADWIVEDDGPGIPEALLKRIGQPFVTSRATGTGMGFAVVRRIMEASRGQLDVGRSGDLGGARIILRFPRRGSQPPGPPVDS